MNFICSKCGKTGDNVFIEVLPKNEHTYTFLPICINCKNQIIKNKINTKQINSIIKRENDLANIENNIANSIVSEKFPTIKFKNQAKQKLIELMRKYSVRTIFELFNKLNFNDFNIIEIENKIKNYMSSSKT